MEPQNLEVNELKNDSYIPKEDKRRKFLLGVLGTGVTINSGATETQEKVNSNINDDRNSLFANTLHFDSIAALRGNKSHDRTIKTCSVTSYYGTNNKHNPQPVFQGNYFIQFGDTTSKDNGGSIIVDAAANRWYLSHSGSLRADQFGADPLGIVDSYKAIMMAIDAITNGEGYYVSAPAIYFSPGKYKIESTIQLKKAIRLYSDGSGLPYSNSTSLIFPPGVSGIVIHRYNTFGPSLEMQPSTAGDGSIIEGLNIIGCSGEPDPFGGHGIYLRARAKITNCYVANFEGDGYHIEATAGAGKNKEGNANGWHIDGGASFLNKRHGLYVHGSDANAGTAIALDCGANGGWGIYDSSFLGNTYVGCQSALNNLGAYKSDGINASNLISGCYSESGQPPSSISYPSIVIGGTHGAGFTSSTQGVLRGNQNGIKISALVTNSADNLLQLTLGRGATPSEIMCISDQSSGSGIWRLTRAPGKIYWNWANIGGSEHFTHYDANNVTLKNGYPRDLSISGPLREHTPIGLTNGYFDKGMLSRISGSAPPENGTWLHGDIIYNTHPSSGTYIGWVCTAPGSPGIWRPFGLIS